MTTEDSARIAEAMPDYEIVRELGRGGMGVVFLGRHRRLERGVAIKELPPSFAVEEEVRERFSTEARTLAGLSHPHIVPIFDYVEREGLCLIVMEQLPGGTVWDRFTTTGLVPPTACAVVMACCAALQYAHDKGVLHLDVKPDNLMFDAEAAVKVTDFGIARVISGDKTLGTVDGQVLGTPAYMSPEQARGDDLTPASDVYAAGVMLYELLSGQLPWQGATTPGELLAQRLREDPIPLRDVAPHVPQPLSDVVMRALSRDAADRYDRAEDFGVAIGEACVDSWGPGWLDHAGVAIVGSERLSLAARTSSRMAPTAPAIPAPAPESPSGETTTGSGPAPGTVAGAPTDEAVKGSGAAPGTVAGQTGDAVTGAGAAPGTVARTPEGESVVGTGAAPGTEARPATPGARETTARPAGAPPTDEPPSDAAVPAAESRPVTAAAAPGPMEFQVVKAASAQPRIEGVDLYDLELADLIGVEDVLDPPKRPWPAIVLAVALFVLTLAVAALGLGEPDREAGAVPGEIELSGVDVTDEDPIEVDLSDDVALRVTDPQLAATVDEVQVEFSYLGIPVEKALAAVRDGEAAIDPGLAQRTVGGLATAAIELRSGNEPVLLHETPIDATQTWYLTAPFVIGALVLLLAFANLESSLKPLRGGHPRFLSSVGAFVSGGVAGVGFVLLSGAMGLAEPTVPSIVASVACGAITGLATVRARLGIAKRSRVRKAVKRAEKTLGVRATAA